MTIVRVKTKGKYQSKRRKRKKKKPVGKYTYLTKWQKKYDDYISSAAWRAKRKQKLESVGHCCQVIGCKLREELECHHLTYKRFGDERMDDLVILCDIHHAIVHFQDKMAKCGCKVTKPVLNRIK